MPIYKMKGKKDGKQKYRVRINYQDNMKKDKQIDRVAYGLEEAKLLEMKLSQELKDEAPLSNLTLQNLFNEYIEAKKHEVRETSLEKKKHNLEKHVLTILGEYRIDKLNVPLLQKWKLSIEKEDFVNRTKQNIYAEFRALLNYAVKMEYINKNPLVAVGNFKDPFTIKKEMQFYTAKEFKKFIKSARKCAQKAQEQGDVSEWHYYVFFNIAFYTGLRKGEIHGLHWDDINDGYMSVKRSVSQKLKGEDRVTPPKNQSSIRTIQLPKQLTAILDAHHTRCGQIDGFNDSLYVCGGPRPLRDTSIQNRSAKYAAMAKIKTIRIHDFRHSHVSLLANEGINIQEIARRLGHSKIEMTWNTYSHLYPREEERAIKILEKIV